VVKRFGLGEWMIEGKVEGEESRGRVGLDFGGDIQYNTGWFEDGGNSRGRFGCLMAGGTHYKLYLISDYNRKLYKGVYLSKSMKTLRALVLALAVALAPKIAQATPIFFAGDSIYGTVGVLDSANAPIQNCLVILKTQNNDSLDAVYTNPNGHFSFTKLTGVETPAEETPRNLDKLVAHILNNPSSNPTIQYNLPKTENVSAKVYDITGRLVSTLINDETQGVGTHNLKLKPNTSNGVYLINLKIGNEQKTYKAIMLKNGGCSISEGINTGVVLNNPEKPLLFPEKILATDYYKLIFRPDTMLNIGASQDSIAHDTGTSTQFNAALYKKIYTTPYGDTVYVNPNHPDSLWRIYGDAYKNPQQWRTWPVNCFLSGCNHQDSLDIVTAIGPLDSSTPSDSSVEKKLNMDYIVGTTDSITRPVLIIHKDAGNSTQTTYDTTGHLVRVVSYTNFATLNIVRHEVTGWGQGKGLVSSSLFPSNMSPSGMDPFSKYDVVYTRIGRYYELLKQSGKQNLNFISLGK